VIKLPALLLSFRSEAEEPASVVAFAVAVVFVLVLLLSFRSEAEESASVVAVAFVFEDKDG
jgi:hypothetical protein